MVKILLTFVLGFVTWSLALARSAAWDSRHVGSLMSIIFIDDLLGIFIGMYLAREGTWADATPCAISCAFGGALAGLVVLLIVLRKEKRF